MIIISSITITESMMPGFEKRMWKSGKGASILLSPPTINDLIIQQDTFRRMPAAQEYSWWMQTRQFEKCTSKQRSDTPYSPQTCLLNGQSPDVLSPPDSNTQNVFNIPPKTSRAKPLPCGFARSIYIHLCHARRCARPLPAIAGQLGSVDRVLCAYAL